MKKKTEYASFFYDRKYQAYVHPAPQTILEKIYVLLSKFEYHRVDAAIDLLHPGKKVLDIGVGDGNLLIKAKKKGFVSLFGIDISNTVIKICRNNLRKNGIKDIHINRQDINGTLKFSNKFFDTVTMIAVLEHIFDVHHTIREIHRVLKKNGQVIVEVPNVCFLPRRFSFLFGKLPKTSDEEIYTDGHLQFFTYKSLKDIFEKNGFVVVEQGSSGIFYKIRNVYPSLLGANILIRATKK